MRQIFNKNLTNIFFLVALLFAIFLIMRYLKGDKLSVRSSSIPNFEEQVKVIDGKYYNKIHNFSISIPNADWEILCLDRVDSLRKQDISQPLLDNINPMLEMYRRDREDMLSIVKVGIIELIEPRTPQSLAKQNLSEIEQSYSAPDSVYIIQDVTLSGSGRLQGAFYVLDINQKVHHPYPRWITMFVVHNKSAYTIMCQVRSDDYAFLKTDFENILQSFLLFNY